MNIRRLGEKMAVRGFTCCICRGRLLVKLPIQARFMSASNSNTVDLAYVSYQQTTKHTGNRPPVIIMHGMMGSRANWQSISKTLSKTGRKVVAVDARNHGESPHAEEMTYSLMRDDVLHLMDKQGYERATLVGHSMGGKTFMSAALTKSDRVSGLVVVDVSPVVSPMRKKYPGYLDMMLRIGSQLIEEKPNIPLSQARRYASKRLHEIEPDPSICQFLASNLIEKDDNVYVWRVNLDSIINNFNVLMSFPQYGSECYEGPTLFLAGQNSSYITSKELPEITRLFSTARIDYVDNAGHWVQADNPKMCIKKINSFLNESGL